MDSADTVETIQATAVHPCPCGFSSTTKSGLTNHQRTCTRAGDKQPSIAADLPLSAQERRSYEKRIVDRRDTMLEALGDQFSGSPEKVIEALRREKGITLTVEQLNELIEGVDRQIEEAISTHIADEQDRLKVEMADIDEVFEEREKEMKERHRKEWVALSDEKKEERKKNAQHLKSAKERVMKESAKELLTTKLKYQSQMLMTRQLEQEIKVESTTRVALLTKSRGRLEHTIKDAANRALEDILEVSTRQQAAELLKRIPTVGEAIEMCKTPDGFGSLLKRLDPSMMLPAPMPETKVTAAVIREAASEISPPDDDEDSSSDQSRNESHDEIYGDRPTRRNGESNYDYTQRLERWNRQQ